MENVSRVVTYKEIKENNYNLNIPRYIDSFEKEEIPEIKEVVDEIIKLDDEIKTTERKLSEMMKELVGENYQSDIAEVLRIWGS